MAAQLLYDGSRQVAIREEARCAHCQRGVPRFTWNGRKLEVIRCAGCSSDRAAAYLCQACARDMAVTGRCLSYERKLDMVAAGRAREIIDAGLSRRAFLRSMGL